jgi:hypothetical protein
MSEERYEKVYLPDFDQFVLKNQGLQPPGEVEVLRKANAKLLAAAEAAALVLGGVDMSKSSLINALTLLTAAIAKAKGEKQ